MWFTNIHARAFGPMRNQVLEFEVGLNIVHGANESGKSTWHAAIATALCGLRRGSGRTKAEQEFEGRHRPWDAGEGDPWFVQAGVMLDDGRHIEIDRDFDNRRTDVRSPDLGGREFTSLSINDGSPDGSMLLGLDREAFPMTASVRQASIVSDLDEPDALQQHLARAAAGGVGGTAAGAIEQIEAYKKEHVGLDRRNSTKPLRTAKNAVAACEANLGAVRHAHREYLDLASALEAHRRKAKRLTSERALAEAQRDYRATKQEADRLGEAIKKLDEWVKQFSAGDPSQGELPDVTELAQALGSVESLPQPETTHLHLADALEARLIEHSSPVAMPCPEMKAVERCVVPLRNADSPRVAKPAAPVASITVGVAGLAGAIVVGALIGLSYGVVLAVAVLAASWELARRTRTSQSRAQLPVPHEARTAALSQLDEWELPHDPVGAVAEASRRIQAQDARCRLAEELRQRREFDAREVQRRQSQEKAWARLRRLALVHGASGSDEDVLRDVQAILNNHAAAGRQRDEDVEDWGRYQEALDGRSLKDWHEDVIAAQNDADNTRRRLDELGAEPVATALGVDELEVEIKRIDGLLQAAGKDANTAGGRLLQVDQDSVDVAAAEARVSEAKAELQRVERLADTLNITRAFLESAAENAHRLLAPKLSAEMSPWVTRVTNGRYQEVQVDPSDLSVTLVTAAHDRRDARLVSRGTTEQIYLVLRLVLAQVLSADHETCPMLLDDPTVHADTIRKKEILDYLLAASEEHQVIVFSQEQEVLDWARKQPAGAVRLIELADPQPA